VVEKLLADKAALLGHHDLPEEDWKALRTARPSERVNQEMKRRSQRWRRRARKD
jgi:transposase-like protein